jgi:putative SOS response-associated peptidase YedK
MCFHISITDNQNSIEKKMNANFSISNEFLPQKHISAFSNTLIPIIHSQKKYEINLFNWGLIPYWIKNIQEANKIRKMTYNAKTETLNDKPSFKYSIRDKKCLIITNGFYEWQSANNKKICYYINSSESSLFTFAGIWSTWLDRTNNKSINSVSILTQEANKTMSFIHNIKKRQPVVLNKKNREAWLDSRLNYSHILKDSYNTNFNYKIVQSPIKT